MGVAAPFADTQILAVPAAPDPESLQRRTQLAGTPHRAAAGFDPLTDPEFAASTLVDVPTQAPQAGQASTQRTLLGVARPGIAPPRPGVAKTPVMAQEVPDPPGYRPLGELGATGQFSQVSARAKLPARAELAHPLGRRRQDKVDLGRPDPRGRLFKAPPLADKGNRRALMLVAAALSLASLAIGVALLWPSSEPITAQIRSAGGGAELVEVSCASCPDGTRISLRDVSAEVSGGRAQLRPAAALPIGDTELRLAIDRPGSARDETVKLPVRVAYRVRPDLATLDADTPSLQIIIEAMEGSKVTLEGEEVVLRDGRAVQSIDVTADLMGPSADANLMLSRKLSFEVRPPRGEPERGVVAVSVPIVPLSIDAPGRAVVTEKATFLLAGRSLPGAEIVVASRSIGISRDGNFSQAMNVSSVGATDILVRARMPGRAPRLARLRVERVTSLEKSAEDFEKKGALAYNSISEAAKESLGKPVKVTGQVLEIKREQASSILIVQSDTPGCENRKCLMRLRQGRPDLEVARGSRIRAFGVLAGLVSHEGADVLDIDVAFSIVSDKPSEALFGLSGVTP